MVQIILISGTIIALGFGMALLILVLIRAIRSSGNVTHSSEIGPLNAPEESATESDWTLSETVIRGYDTPELYREDRFVRSGRSTADKQLR